MKILVQFAFLFFVFSSKAQSLSGTNWVLTSIYDETNENILKETKVKGKLIFETDSTYAGILCNQYYGRYKSDKTDAIKMERPAGTLMYCFEISKLESQLYGWYENVKHYTVSGEQLFLFTDKLKLVFTKQ